MTPASAVRCCISGALPCVLHRLRVSRSFSPPLYLLVRALRYLLTLSQARALLLSLVRKLSRSLAFSQVHAHVLLSSVHRQHCVSNLSCGSHISPPNSIFRERRHPLNHRVTLSRVRTWSLSHIWIPSLLVLPTYNLILGNLEHANGVK